MDARKMRIASQLAPSSCNLHPILGRLREVEQFVSRSPTAPFWRYSSASCSATPTAGRSDPETSLRHLGHPSEPQTRGRRICLSLTQGGRRLVCAARGAARAVYPFSTRVALIGPVESHRGAGFVCADRQRAGRAAPLSDESRARNFRSRRPLTSSHGAGAPSLARREGNASAPRSIRGGAESLGANARNLALARPSSSMGRPDGASSVSVDSVGPAGGAGLCKARLAGIGAKIDGAGGPQYQLCLERRRAWLEGSGRRRAFALAKA